MTKTSVDVFSASTGILDELVSMLISVDISQTQYIHVIMCNVLFLHNQLIILENV